LFLFFSLSLSLSLFHAVHNWALQLLRFLGSAKGNFSSFQGIQCGTFIALHVFFFSSCFLLLLLLLLPLLLLLLLLLLFFFVFSSSLILLLFLLLLLLFFFVFLSSSSLRLFFKIFKSDLSSFALWKLHHSLFYLSILHLFLTFFSPPPCFKYISYHLFIFSQGPYFWSINSNTTNTTFCNNYVSFPN